MKEKRENRKKKWIRLRHKIVRNIVFAILYPYSKIKYGVTIEKIKEDKGRQYLVLYNHQTAFDQFFLGMAFKSHLYYLATEDLFSRGLLSKLISFLVAPIPIKKQTTDVRAIMTCIRVAKEGGSIAIAPEGNRTYSGKTEYMSPSIVPLARKLGLPVLLYRIEGGYGVHPRWSDVVRKGRMNCRVARIIEPEEYCALSDGELMDIIKSGLYVNEANDSESFYHKKSAEYLERAIYVCPICGLSSFESSGDRIRCKRCGLVARYTETKRLVCDSSDFRFEFVADWYDYQNKFILDFDPSTYFDKPIYEESAELRRVIPYKKKVKLSGSAHIALFGNKTLIRTEDGELDFPFSETSAVAVLGKNKLNIYYKGEIYQLKGDKRFNALKYVHLYHRYKQIEKGDKNGQFLGL